MVFNFNAVEVNPPPRDGATGEPPTLGVGLYNIACRLNHSCQPNCCWYATEDGARLVRTLVPVAEGEQLTIDYEMERYDIKPVPERQDNFALSWEFCCACPRCASFGDDTRKVACTNGSCELGHHLVHQPTEEDVAVLTPCLLCGTHPSETTTHW